MEPFTAKFNDIKLENTPLGIVKDIIFEKYLEICDKEIKKFEREHKQCEFCLEWFKSGWKDDRYPFYVQIVDACQTCRNNYVIFKCEHCKYLYDDIDIGKIYYNPSKKDIDAYCYECYNEKIDFKCPCGETYKLWRGYNDSYCSRSCDRRYEEGWRY